MLLGAFFSQPSWIGDHAVRETLSQMIAMLSEDVQAAEGMCDRQLLHKHGILGRARLILQIYYAKGLFIASSYYLNCEEHSYEAVRCR